MTGIHSAFTFIAVLTQSLTTTYDALFNNHTTLLKTVHIYSSSPSLLYQLISSLTEWCDCYTGHHMLLSQQYSNEGECWMYASLVIIGMFLLFLQAPKWKQVARRSQDRLDNFVLALFHCAPCIYWTTALLGDSKWLCGSCSVFAVLLQ